jgi:DEAD/DEAH box helicase domain-containing protein
VPFPIDLHPALADALQSKGIQSLYSHQVAAWQYARAGRHVGVVTGTASGKTLCYNLPVLDMLLRDPEARALYLFPTKALAQDQQAALKELLSGAPQSVVSAIYDGDTPTSHRPAVRSKARLVLSNPDMLHTGILPHHTAWADFWRGLRFVVLDEMHVYRGVFGSHVANVLRRLKRIAAFYGAEPKFILTSATIGNPGELAERLVESPVAMVDEDGSARGPRHFLIYNPPVTDPELGLRRSVLQESVRLADDLLAYGLQTIVFGRTRRSVEIILTTLRERSAGSDIPAQPPTSADNSLPLRGYRSGYLPSQRRAIEQGLRQGDVRLVVATTALELGIDIGSLEAAVLAGYPGTIAASRQQAGRAGRGEAPALAVMVASASPLDQFLARHPDYFFDRTPEQGLINPDNLLILLEHLRCAAFELPFQTGEGFGSLEPGRVQEFLDVLQGQGVLHRSGPKYFWAADQYPAQGISLRSASPEAVVLQVQEAEDSAPRTLGQVDAPSASWMVHPGAVYLHEAQMFYVRSLDLEQRLAVLAPANSEYYTEPRLETSVELVEKTAEASVSGGLKAYGQLLVTTQVVGYRKVRWHTHENLGLADLDLPPSQLDTTGYWLALSPAAVDSLREQGLWSNDANQYGPGWAALRQKVRARDDYRCQACGLPEEGRAHDVHHKIPFRAFASAAQANQPHNLVTLCPACHRRAEAAVRMRSGLSGLAFTLGHLAPLFLMCDARDLGVHADPQASLAEGAPAVVLYDRVPAGIGFSERLYELHTELMLRARELVAGCACTDGCPSCVGPGGEAGQAASGEAGQAAGDLSSSGGKRDTLAILDCLANTLDELRRFTLPCLIKLWLN